MMLVYNLDDDVVDGFDDDDEIFTIYIRAEPNKNDDAQNVQ